MLSFLFFLTITIIVFILAWPRLNSELKITFTMYFGAYITTTLIGATLIGLTDNRLAIEVLQSYGIATSLLPRNFDFGYWVLLYCPIFMPLLTVLMIKTIFYRLPIGKIDWLNQPVSFFAFLFVFMGFVLYFAVQIPSIISSDEFFNLRKNLDYQSSIFFRYHLFHQLNTVFYGLAYTTMPTLSHVALYQWSRTRSIDWGSIFLISLLITSFLYILLFLKGVLLVYLISLGFGLFILKVVKSYNMILIFGAVILIIVTFYQLLMHHNWEILDSIFLLIFRVASSFPFFYTLFPDVLPYTGIYLGISFLGMKGIPNTNQVVWRYMYPETSWVEGSVVGPAQLLAYTQAGFIFAIFITMLIGVLIYWIGHIGTLVRGPLTYSLYIQLLVFVYYLTQVSLQSALFSSFGIIWAFLGIGILWITTLIFQNACSPQRS